MKNVLILGGLLIASLGFAETDATIGTGATSTESATTTTTAQVPSTTTGGVVGLIELRPSFNLGAVEGHSENQVQLGYKFANSNSLKAVTEFNTHMYTDKGGAATIASLQSLHSRADIPNFATLPGDITLSYQNRLYAPIAEGDEGKNKILSIRNYLMASKKVGEKSSVSLWVVPIVHGFRHRSYVNADKGGRVEASPVFENRVYLLSDIGVGPFTVSPAIWWSATKHRSVAPSVFHNDGWSNHLEVDLDVTLALNDKVNVGVGYYSGNMLQTTSQGFYDGINSLQGVKSGFAQLILNASL